LSRTLTFTNRQKVRRVNIPLLRRIVTDFLRAQLKITNYDLNICLVDEASITELNEKFVRHKGSTDVITFDYSDGGPLAGEVFVCLPQAIAQAQLFNTSWQSELLRYIVHGVLHLQGYDDQTPSEQRKMKTAEDRFLRELSGDHTLQNL
jgi:probable rRNA maturation factor